MNNNNWFHLAILVIITSCNSTSQQKNEADFKNTAVQLTSNNVSASFIYATHDSQNRTVLCWIEEKNDSNEFYFSVYNKDENNFNDPILVAPANGLTPHRESTPKVAFKEDGTIVAVFGHRRRIDKPDAMFEGEIYFSQSFDKGESWTEAAFLHSDTSSGYSRSFFDIATLPEGEVAAIWIDGRMKYENGSSLYFAKTNKNAGFGNDKPIAEKICECCRTDIYTDDNGRINIAFRNIISDSIRDISTLISTNNGDNFTESQRISRDNWVLYGCPHSGPAITSDSEKSHFFWFTQGGGEGVYYASKAFNDNDFSQRELINPHARHPQTTSLGDGSIVLVWDEVFKTGNGFNSRIGMRFQKPGDSPKTFYITSESENAVYPIVSQLEENNLMVAWTNIDGDKSKIYYQIFEESFFENSKLIL